MTMAASREHGAVNRALFIMIASMSDVSLCLRALYDNDNEK